MFALKRWLCRAMVVGAALAATAGSASAQTFIWIGNSTDIWGSTANWNLMAFPNSNSATASFSNGGLLNPSSPLTVSVDSSYTVGAMDFSPGPQNITAWTLAPTVGTNTLTLTGVGSTVAPVTVATGTTATINVNTNGVGITKAGPSSLTLNGTNVYTGSSAVNAGTLQIGTGATNGSFSGTVSIGASGTIQVGNGGSGGTISGNITNNGTLAFNKSSGTNTYTNSLSGGGALTKTGASTLTFTGNSSTFSGTTTLNANAGTVRVNAGAILGQSGSQTVSVGSGTTLGGEGTIGGTVSYNTGSILDVGDGTANDIGTLTYSNTLNFNAGATTTFNFNQTLGDVAGVGYDRVNAGVINLGGVFNAQFVNGGSNVFGTMNIIEGTSRTGTFSDLSQGAEVLQLAGFAGISQWFIDYTATGVNITPIPEPASVIGVAAAGLGLARWVRRRRQTTAVAVTA